MSFPRFPIWYAFDVVENVSLKTRPKYPGELNPQASLTSMTVFPVVRSSFAAMRIR